MWANQTNRPSTQHGFTFIEILIAISIFAMLGVATSAVFSTVTKANEASELAQNHLRGLQRAMTLMERDFTQMVPRTSRDSAGDLGKNLFDFGDYLYDSDGQGIRFYRLGWLNPDGMLPRSSLQQVHYRIKENTLQRLHTLYPDPVVGTEAIELDLLHGVEEIKFSFFIESSWQMKTVGQTFPRAIAVELVTEQFGSLRRIFLLPHGFTSDKDDEDSNEPDPDAGSDADDPKDEE